ncbi:MAG: xanthine dehydrogenase family protein molybdopterin-binding subunit [Planctomycetota bacterium]|nr:xanthine dehydrogenase family protein molybdopterin-binding subunit [Planctomycetota bacterium]
MARTQEGPAWKPRGELKLLNTDIPRVDGPDKVSGRAKYTHDIRVPGMLYGRVLMCPRPAARVTVDVAPALELRGVKVAIPLTDSLGDEGKTSYLGQPIAAVAAETPEQAEDGLRAIRAEYEDVGWAITYDQAVAEGAPQTTQQEGNVREGRSSGDRDEVAAALEGCDAVVEATYTMPVQHHCCLETHGVVVDYRGGDEATIYASTQMTFNVASPADEILGVPKGNVHAVVEHMGGGFGSKFSLDVSGRIACQLAKAATAPVHLMFTRRDEFLAGGNRSGGRQTLKGGATKDGRFVALDASVVRLGGIGRGSSGRQPYIYSAEKAFSETMSVFTSTDSSRAMRAPGHPQSSFAIESMVDELAHGIGMDPLEFRKKNLEDPVYHRQLDRVAQEIGWFDHPNRSGPPDRVAEVAIGIGFGVATWGGGGRGGPSGCKVEVRIESDGSVTSSVGSQDLGTGTRTYVAAIPAEELGLPLERVTARIGSSRLGMSVGSGGSITTASLAPAVKAAAHDARVKLFAHLAPLMGTTPDKLAAEGGDVFETTDPSNRLSWDAVCKSLGASPIVGNGEFVKELQASGVHGAQAARVEVDTLTGEVRVLKMVAIQDCGLPMNRLATRSQLNGGMIQALSYGLFEERVIDPWLGTLMSGGFEDYRIAGSTDMPELVAILDDDDERHAVIGMGEPAVIPGQSAIANAVFNACGARVRDLPLTRDKVLKALGRLG